MRQAAVAPIRPQPANEPPPARQKQPARIQDARRRREVLEQFQEAARWKRTGSRSRTARLDADERAYERAFADTPVFRQVRDWTPVMIARGGR